MISIQHALARIREEHRPVRFLASRALWHSGLSRWLTIDRGRYRLRFFPTALSAQYWLHPAADRVEEQFFAAYLRPGDTVVDVGANIGALTLLAASLVGPAGRVVAFEAHPRIFRYLEANLRMNGASAVQARNVAAGDQAETIRFSDHRADDQNAVSERGGVAVPCERLDSALAGVGEVQLLKVDTEGFEKFVFAGAGKVLSRTRCVYFESWEEHCARYGYTSPELVAALRGAGFEVFRLEGRALLPILEGHRSDACEDLVATRDPSDLAARTGFDIR